MQAYPAVFTPEARGGYSVRFPDCRGCATCGDALAEAKAMAGDALLGWLLTTRELGGPVPSRSRMVDVRRTAGRRERVILITPMWRRERVARSAAAHAPVPWG